MAKSERPTLRDGLPSQYTLSFARNNAFNKCQACRTSMLQLDSVLYRVLPCECVLSHRCADQVNDTCFVCGSTDVSGVEYDEQSTNDLRASLTVTDTNSGWSGTFKEAKKRVKDSDGGISGGGGGTGGANTMMNNPSTPNTNGELLVFDNDGLIPATEEPYQTFIYWDYDNIQAPNGEANFVKFYTSMVRSLEKKMLRTEPNVESDKRVIYSRHFVDCKIFVGGKHPARDDLKEQASKLNAHVVVAGTKKEAADRAISVEISKQLNAFKDDFEDEAIPHNIIIVSSDMDFAEQIERCGHHNVTPVWVHNVKEGTEHHEVLSYRCPSNFKLSSLVSADLLPLTAEPAAPTTPASKMSSRQPTLEEQLAGVNSNTTSQPNTPLTSGGSKPTAASIAKKVSSANAAVANKPEPAATKKETAAAETKKEHVPQRVVATSKGSKEAKEDKTYPVDGTYVLESLLIRNRALDYLDQFPYRSGKKCTNPREHDIQDCSFIHFRRNPNSRRR